MRRSLLRAELPRLKKLDAEANQPPALQEGFKRSALQASEAEDVAVPVSAQPVGQLASGFAKAFAILTASSAISGGASDGSEQVSDPSIVEAQDQES